LNTLEGDHLSNQGVLSVSSVHLAAGALQLAFADRARYLGDPDFVKVPTTELTSKDYARARRALIPADRALKASEVHAGEIAGSGDSSPGRESNETTHLSIIDSEGNAVASTQTVNGWLGAAVVIPGTGVLLNNEMDDFSAKTGASNMFGAIGGPANSIAPAKTPLSAMSPTLLLKDGKVVLSVGAPGGTRIISCVAQTILNWAEFKLPLRESIATVRYHHQWQPDLLTLDPPGPAPATLRKLQEMGYHTELSEVPCNVMAVERVGDQIHAVADPRDIGIGAAE
jgi:gamma-glutamyltranspeptidase / glutathione hydrolase